VTRAHHAIDPGEIALAGGNGVSRRAHDRFDRFREARSYFKYYFSSRSEPSWKSSRDLAIEVHSVSTTLERNPRFEVAHFGRQCGELRFGDVRRVRYDQIERSE
jgi:hypothetical protein